MKAPEVAEHPSVAGGGLTLTELVRELPLAASVEGDEGVRVRGVHQDSRRIQKGDLFVARAGAHADGARFIESARAAGAAAVLCDTQAVVSNETPIIRVGDVPRALAYAAAAVYGHPSFALDVVGVTGTNGKTTTVHLIQRAIDGALRKPSCGTIGTVGHAFGDLRIDATHTTPESDELARVLSSMREHGATHVAMEVSSIALSTARVSAVRFRVAAFTNLTQDHLDFHGTMDKYAAAKAALFTDLAPDFAVLNVDDPFGQELARKARCPTIKISSKMDAGPSADIAPISLSLSDKGILGRLRTPVGEVALSSRLIGAHNVENLLVTLGVCHALELDLKGAARALDNELGAPGRLERCEEPGDEVMVLVDYAHTPDALRRALDAVRGIAPGRVLCVFGCGGDRDKTKRSPMGRIAGERANVVFVTNDNPRGEVPDAIAAAIVLGLSEVGVPKLDPGELQDASRGYIVALDRAHAIRAAVVSAKPGDVVLVAGKGHETYQIVANERRTFDDRVEAREALTQRRRALRHVS